MTIDIYTATGTKKGTMDLPASIFGSAINEGLVHQAVVLQQSNRRGAIAHAKGRSEVKGSTRKLFQQKGTGRARRGSIRSPLLRGGGKAFGPRSNANYMKNMPQKMRHAALRSCLSMQAGKAGIMLGLEAYPKAIKTKDAHALLTKLPVTLGRKILLVVPERHHELALSTRNISGVKTILASYLNPEDVLTAWHIIFVGDALKKVEEVFAGSASAPRKSEADAEKKPKAKKKTASKKSSKTA